MLQRICVSLACMLAVFAGPGSLSAGDCAAPHATCGGAYAAQPYATGAQPYYGAGPQYSYGYAASRPYYAAEPRYYAGAPYAMPMAASYSVFPVRYSFDQPSAPNCASPYGAQSYGSQAYGIFEVVGIVGQIIDIIEKLRRPSEPSPQPDDGDGADVSKACQEFDQRLNRIEAYLKAKDPAGFQAGGAANGNSFIPPPPPAGFAFGAAGDVSATLKSIDKKLEKVEKIDAFLKTEFPNKYQ